MASRRIAITGNDLTIRQVHDVVLNPETVVEVTEAAYLSVVKAKEFLEDKLGKEIVYGVNTGFGPMASRVIDRGKLTSLQYNLIRSHAVGIGDPIPDSHVLAAMVVRLNTLAKGYSGISSELIECFQNLVNERIIPVVPEHGAVGTSGDLVQLAHIALAIIGEGEVVYRGVRRPAALVL